MIVFFLLAVVGAFYFAHAAAEHSARFGQRPLASISYARLRNAGLTFLAMLMIGVVGFLVCQIRSLVG